MPAALTMHHIQKPALNHRCGITHVVPQDVIPCVHLLQSRQALPEPSPLPLTARSSRCVQICLVEGIPFWEEYNYITMYSSVW